MSHRTLFLDDNPARRRWATLNLGVGTELVTVKDVDGAIAALGDGNPWAIVYLDHDLGEETFVDSSRPDCGMAVVRWAIANRPSVGEFVVHSLNTPAGHEMVGALNVAGYTARYRSFYRMAHSEIASGDQNLA